MSRAPSSRTKAVTVELSDAFEDGPPADHLELVFSGELWYWRGPAPWYFVTVPERESAAIRAVSAVVTYGWGVIPVRVRIGDSVWGTSLFPKDGRYVVPIKSAMRKAERLEQGDTVLVHMAVEA